MDSKLNVFVVGSPRSGTTWIGKMFDSSENVLYRHEPDSVHQCPDLPFVPDKREAGSFSSLAGIYLNELVDTRATKAAGSLPIFPKIYRGIFGTRLLHFLTLVAKAYDKTISRLPFSGKGKIPDLIPSRKWSDVTTVIKSVDSLPRTYTFSLAAPKLKIIHIIRHPCAYVSSQLRGRKLNLMAVDPFLTTQVAMEGARRRGLSLSSLEALSLEEQLASLWMLQNEKVIEEMRGCDRYRVVLYEDLCEDPQYCMNQLFDFTGLQFSKQVADFIAESQAEKSGDERYFQITRDSQVAANKWRRELSEDQIHRIMRIVYESEPGRLFVE